MEWRTTNAIRTPKTQAKQRRKGGG
jgi:hypothetical protein